MQPHLPSLKGFLISGIIYIQTAEQQLSVFQLKRSILTIRACEDKFIAVLRIERLYHALCNALERLAQLLARACLAIILSLLRRIQRIQILLL